MKNDSVIGNHRARVGIRCPLTIILFFVLCTSHLFAQSFSDYVPKNHLWLTAGYGFSLHSDAFGGGGGIVLSYSHRQTIVSVRHLEGTGGLVPFGSSPTFSQRFSESAILYGKIWRERSSMFSVSGGAGYQVVSFRGSSPNSGFSVIGVAVESEGYMMLAPAFGIGIYSYANINPRSSLFGAMVSLQVGKAW